MNTGRPNSVADVGGPEALLLELCRPFAPRGFAADCEVVHADAIPAPADKLLVHHNHMTVELERHYGKPVEVRVLEEHWQGDIYTRKIILVLSGKTQIVEWGIARLDTRYLSPEVIAEIRAKQSPLGAILIRHQVHRRIKPRYFVRFPVQSLVIDLFGESRTVEPVFGRLGTIYCDNEPAIELLEIVRTEIER